MNEIAPSSGHLRRIPSGVWIIGFVSMLMDISSEMIHSLLPIYLVTVLGTSTLTVGIIEGVAEATASITKVFSGALSDWLGKRKLLATIGYGLAACTKPIFPLASTVSWLIAARFVDRIGKGIRGAPRDALVADLAPADLRGASFGLRQSLDTIGAFLGPAIAIALMWVTANDFRTVFWFAVVPAFLAFALIAFAVHDPAQHADSTSGLRSPLSKDAFGKLGRAYWWIVGIGAVFTLARFSEAFLLLKAQAAGLPIYLAPLVLVLMNIAYALTSYPAGVLSDRMDRGTLLMGGFAVLATADIVLGVTTGLIGVTFGVILWGVHMGLTQGLFAALIADVAPVELRGTAYGIFNLVGGLALLVASVMAGALWDIAGAELTFLAGAAFTVVALTGLVVAIYRFDLRKTVRSN
jgi:MFS family permease